MAIKSPKLLSVASVIDYADGPIIFTALDPVGTRFLCTFLQTVNDATEYICAPLSHARLNSFLKGNVDLRSIYTESENGEFYKLSTTRTDEQPLKANQVDLMEIPEKLLPDPGYFVDPNEDWDGSEEERTHSLVELSLEVAASKNHPVIGTYTLCEFLRGFQDTMKFAQRHIAPVSRRQKGGREEQDFLSHTEVYGFSLSSFTVKLRSYVTSREIFGLSDFDKSAEMLAELFDLVSTDSALAIDFLRENKGHFVSAVKRFLTVATNEGCAFAVGWRLVKTGHFYKTTRVTFEQANRLKSLLSVRSELDIEEANYTGHFTGLLHNRSTWKFQVDGGDEINGVEDPEQKDQLAGVTYLSAKYKIHCTEQFTVDGVDRQKMHRVLKVFTAVP